MATCLHIGHPTDKYAHGLAGCINGFTAGGGLLQICGGWQIRTQCYDGANSLVGRDFCSLVLARPGPVLLLEPIQGKALADIRARLQGRCLVLVAHVYDAATLGAEIQRVKDASDRGEPFLPIDVVVALLVLRKLERDRCWTGKEKGYMWGVNVPKGRGVDEKFGHRVPHALNLLLQEGLVVSKISNGKPKYALNPDRRPEIYNVLRLRDFPGRLGGMFRRFAEDVPARELNLLDIYDGTGASDISEG